MGPSMGTQDIMALAKTVMGSSCPTIGPLMALLRQGIWGCSPHVASSLPGHTLLDEVQSTVSLEHTKPLISDLSFNVNVLFGV